MWSWLVTNSQLGCSAAALWTKTLLLSMAKKAPLILTCPVKGSSRFRRKLDRTLHGHITTEKLTIEMLKDLKAVL